MSAPGDHQSPLEGSGKSSRIFEDREESALERLEKEIETEERELERVYSLPYSGEYFEAYIDGLRQRIRELKTAKRHIFRLLKK